MIIAFCDAENDESHLKVLNQFVAYNAAVIV